MRLCVQKQLPSDSVVAGENKWSLASLKRIKNQKHRYSAILPDACEVYGGLYSCEVRPVEFKFVAMLFVVVLFRGSEVLLYTERINIFVLF